MPIGVPEQGLILNRQPRCPCVLLLDNSYSMEGDPIDQLNEGLMAFTEALSDDDLASQRVEVAIVSFGPVKKVQDFVTIDDYVPSPLEVDGGTPMGEAITTALDMLEERKQSYKEAGVSYFRPWVFLITDGGPTDEWHSAAQNVHNGEAAKRFLFYAVGVEGANFDVLRQIAPPNRPPLQLQSDSGMFREMFLWLSASLLAITHSVKDSSATSDDDSAIEDDDMVELPPATGWGQAPST